MRTRAAAASLILVASCGGGASSGAPPTPLTVWVLDEPLTFDGDVAPLASTPVAFDPPGGGPRVTKTTEADGHVTFEGDFTLGGASVTVLSSDHVYVTMLEASPDAARARPNALGKPDGDLVILPPRLDSVTTSLTVSLSGHVVGKNDANDVVYVAASGMPRLGKYLALQSTYTLRAPKDRPFFLLAAETKELIDDTNQIVTNDLVKAFRIDLAGRGDDELVDLDIAPLPALPSKLLHVHAQAPQSPASPFGAGTTVFATVTSADSDLVTGVFAPVAKPTADGKTFDVDVALVDTDVGGERLVSRAVLTAPDTSQSIRTEPGVMADGTVFSDFPLPPTIPAPDAKRKVTDPIPLDGFPAGADLEANVIANGQLAWVLYGPPGGPRGKSFSIPYHGEITGTEVDLLALSLTASTGLVTLPKRGSFYRYRATFRDIALTNR